MRCPSSRKLDLAVQDRGELLQPRADVERAEQVLLLLERDVEVRGDQVGDLRRVLDVHDHDLQLVRQVRDHGDELGKLVHHVRLDRLEVLRGLDQVLEHAHLRAQVRVALRVLDDLDAPEPLHEVCGRFRRDT
jgi:hypothetical protein